MTESAGADPRGLRTNLSQVARRVAPPDSGLRAGLRLGRQVARDGVEYLPRLRSIWALASQPAPAAPDYATWAAADRVGADDLTDQILFHADHPRAVVVDVVVDANRRDLP